MSQTAEHEQIRHAFAESFDVTLSDAEVAHITTTMPIAAYLITSGARCVDDFLRTLPDSLLSLLDYVACEFRELVDTRDPKTWDDEWLYLVTQLSMDEADGDETTYEEMSRAAISFARLITVELWRRNGVYRWVAPYSLRSSRLPATIRTKWNEISETEH